MKKSLKFLAFFLIFAYMTAFTFGGTVFMLMEGGWTAIAGAAITLATIAALPHLDSLMNWLLESEERN